MSTVVITTTSSQPSIKEVENYLQLITDCTVLEMNTFQLVTVLLIIQFKACCLMPLVKRSTDDAAAPSNSLQQAIYSLNTLGLVLQYLHEQDFHDGINDLVQLHQVHEEMMSLEESLGASKDIKALRIILEFAVNQSCDWLKHEMKNDDFTCTRADIIWLSTLKPKLQNVTKSIKTSLESKNTPGEAAYQNPCQWITDNIYCSDQPIEEVKILLEENMSKYVNNCNIQC